MAERSGFFPDVSGDRSYTSDWLAKYIASFIGNGVYDGELAVTAGDGMAVTLPAGRAWINGYHYRNDGPLALPVDNADGVLNRKDIVVLRWDVNARSITAQVLTGTFSSSPIAPAIVRSAEQYDLKLAEISIPAGTTAITQSLITDTRLDNSVCGIVTGVVKQVDTTTLYQQIQDDLTRFRTTNEADFTGWSAEQRAAFDAWLQTMKDIPPDDAAAYLQNQINAINTDKLDAAEKGQPSGICPLGTDGLVPKQYLNLNFSGKLVVHVASSDGGSVAGTRVRIRNEQLGSNYVQTIDALGNTTFSLIDNHTYYVVLLDYPSIYYGAAATVTITGGETQELTLTLKTEPDVVGWRENVATGEIQYTDGAANFQPMKMTSGTLDAGSWGQNWICDMRPCLLKAGIVQYYLKKTADLTFDYTKQANGTASDIVSGDDGDVMIEFPRVYYKFFDETDSQGVHWIGCKYSRTPADDSWCCNAWLNKNGVPQEVMYMSAYDGEIYNSKLRSLSGVTPTVSQTIGAFRTAANSNGTGYEQQEWSKHIYVASLFPMLFKGLDSQALLGKGVSSASAKINTGSLNSKPLFWGDQSGTAAVKFAGIENFWGNIWKWCDGLITDSSGWHYRVFGPYNDAGSGYTGAGSVPDDLTSAYTDSMTAANGFGMLPKTSASDADTAKFHDYVWATNSSSLYFAYTSGGWYNGANAGAFNLNVNNTASNVDSAFGGALSYTPV